MQSLNWYKSIIPSTCLLECQWVYGRGILAAWDHIQQKNNYQQIISLSSCQVLITSAILFLLSGGRLSFHSPDGRWSLRFPNSCSPVAPHALLWVAGSDGSVGSPLAAGCLSHSFSLPPPLPSVSAEMWYTHHVHTHTHAQTTAAFSKPLAAVRFVLFWPAPIRPVESVNLYSLGRKAISGRSHWASCFMLPLRDSHWEGDWRAHRA